MGKTWKELKAEIEMPPSKDWRELKAKIEEETRRSWAEEPVDSKKVRLGIIDSNVGSYGQYFSVLVFLNGDLRALGIYCLYGLTVAAEDPAFTLEQLKKMVGIFTFAAGEFCGCCGLTMLWEFVRQLNHNELLDTIKTKEEFRELLTALTAYANRMQHWVHTQFPWGLGVLFPKRKPKEIEELAKLAGIIK